MMYNAEHIKVIGFDADDTLWPHQPYFDEMEAWFHQTMGSPELEKTMLDFDVRNLEIYGFGVKGFILSMIEVFVAQGRENVGPVIQDILNKGKELLQHPINVYPGVADVLKQLKGKYRLVILTKGDLLDQARKIEKSDLKDYFDLIEIMPDKKTENYKRFLQDRNIDPSEFLMIGNSMGSDILPVIELGGSAIHIPAESTWAYDDQHGKKYDEKQFYRIQSISCLSDVIRF